MYEDSPVITTSLESPQSSPLLNQQLPPHGHRTFETSSNHHAAGKGQSSRVWSLINPTDLPGAWKHEHAPRFSLFCWDS